MAVVSDEMDSQSTPPANVAMHVDSEALNRFGSVIRHLLVGLVDQAVNVRLVSRDPRIETLRLGPVQTVLHERIGWPVTGRRMDALSDMLSQNPPTIVHAASGASYRVALETAETFDADFVVQVTSLGDCDAVLSLPLERVGRFLALSTPLFKVLTEQVGISKERIDLARPGVFAAQETASFSNPDRVPAFLCVSALERKSGVDLLVNAVQLLRQRGHTFMLFLLGEGRREPTARRMVRDHELSGYVTFAHPSGDLSRAMGSADIVVRPAGDIAFHEDSLQAMGAGIAVVSMSGSVYDHLHDGETAVVCDSLSAQALADGIERLLTDQEFARKLAGAGQEYVRKHHAASQMAGTVANTYREILAGRPTLSTTEESA